MPYVYDGQSVLYVANGELSLTPQAVQGGWVQSAGASELVLAPPHTDGPQGGDSSRGGARRFGGTLVLKRTSAADVGFEGFMAATAGDARRVKMMVVDVVLKSQSSSVCKRLSDAFYDNALERSQRPWAERHKISGGLSELWLGYRHAAVYTQLGPMLQVDRAASCMLAPIRLQEFIALKLKVSHGIEFTAHTGSEPRLNGVTITSINHKLTEGTRNIKVCSVHRMSTDRKTPLKEYVVRGLDSVRCDEVRFQEVCRTCERCQRVADKNAPIEERCERPEWTTLIDWFGRNFPGFPITRPDQPCVLVGSLSQPDRLKLPLEFLSILPAQPVQDNGAEAKLEMLTKTAAAPRERFSKIQQIVCDQFASGNAHNRVSQSFGMQVSPKAVKTIGRVLPPCKLQYGGNWNATPRNGSWNLNNVRFQKPEGTRWAIVMCASPKQVVGVEIETFVETLDKVANERGMSLGLPVGSPIEAYSQIETAARRPKEGLFEQFLTNEVTSLEQASRLEPGSIGLLLAVLGDTMSESAQYVYPTLKRWSHTVSGIPVQCCQVSKALKTGDRNKMANSPQYVAGLLLKINLKLGGENCYAVTPECINKSDEGIALMQQEPQGTMVVGLDVHHASPGSQGASYAAVYATLDMRCVKPRTIITSQEMLDDPNGGSRKQRQEIVLTLYDTMVSLLREFCDANYFDNGGRPPRRIIFFRDGVAHNQFEAIAEQEIEQVTSACKYVNGGSPIPLVFIVTQMRTRARFATEDGRPLPSSTILDRDIVGQGTCEWYAQPHHVITSNKRPASGRSSHYHVLVNDPRLAPTELQRFAVDLCHLYQRATKVVSRPAHLYYAHLAAAFGPYYDSSYKERNGHWDNQSTSSHGSDSSSGMRRELHPAMKNRLYFA